MTRRELADRILAQAIRLETHAHKVACPPGRGPARHADLALALAAKVDAGDAAAIKHAIHCGYAPITTVIE